MMPATRVLGILLLALSAGCAGVKEAPRTLASAQLEPLGVDPALISPGPSGTKQEAVAVATPLRPQVQEVQAQAAIAPAPPATAPSAPPAPAMTGGKTIGTEPVASAPALVALSRSPSAPRTATPPTKVAAAPVIIAQPPKNADPLPAARTPAPPLDVAALKARLRDTDAIGVFTKLALGNQVDDLLKQFRQHHQSGDKAGVASLREPYNILVLKVLALVQDNDPSLARTISASREAIWAILADPEKFLAVDLNGNATTRSSA
jgi:hypothetical protein